MLQVRWCLLGLIAPFFSACVGSAGSPSTRDLGAADLSFPADAVVTDLAGGGSGTYAAQMYAGTWDVYFDFVRPDTLPGAADGPRLLSRCVRLR